MKRQNIILAALLGLSVSVLSSCGISSALQLNHYATVTNVTLSNANYKVMEHVTGSSTQEYILMIGAMNKPALYSRAKSDLMQNAKLSGSAKALINIIAEEHAGGVPPFYIKRTVTYSGDVIEFTK